MRILLVEDEPMLAEALVEALLEERYAVDLAVDGTTADKLIFLNLYDLLILDESLPPPSGIELLRSWRCSGKKTPLLMLTGPANGAQRVSGFHTGADDYLGNPFSLRELLGVRDINVGGIRASLFVARILTSC